MKASGARHERARLSDDVPVAALGASDGQLRQAPSTRAAMTALLVEAEAAGQAFYCPTALGGCGQDLIPVNGQKLRPHFRHYAHSACQFRGAVARDNLTHWLIQQELVGWLYRRGISAKTEVFLDPDQHSRVDVFVIEDPAHVIEVQLSPETVSSRRKRTERYGGNVSWLFGDLADSHSSRDAMLDEDGVVLMVRLQADTHKPTSPAPADSACVEIGLRTAAHANERETTDWFPLDACTFDAVDGIRTPGYVDRKATVDRHRAEQKAEAEQRRQAEEQAEEERRQREARRAALAAGMAEYERSRPGPTSGPPARPMPGPRPTVLSMDDLLLWESRFGQSAAHGGPWLRVLEHHAHSYARKTSLVDGSWATGLPEHLVDPAWAALFLTMIIVSGPVEAIVSEDMDPGGLIVDRLATLGLIATQPWAGIDSLRYEVIHDLRGIGSSLPWHQPPAWPMT